ncbi:hypothetical protein GCM10010381_56770 [Streptomyces xantholiticus]|nr:hypothetical protein GCM10010381_56770 [Streptomyces xantholiticus]
MAADSQSPLRARLRKAARGDGCTGPGPYVGGGGAAGIAGDTGADGAAGGAVGGGGGADTSGSRSFPHFMQKRASSGDEVPQCWQYDAMGILRNDRQGTGRWSGPRGSRRTSG